MRRCGSDGGNGGSATDIRVVPSYYNCIDTSGCCQGYNNIYISSSSAGGLSGCPIERLILSSAVTNVGSFGFNGCSYLRNGISLLLLQLINI